VTILAKQNHHCGKKAVEKICGLSILWVTEDEGKQKPANQAEKKESSPSGPC